MEIPQEIRDRIFEELKGRKTAMLGWPWSWPTKTQVTEKSLIGKSIHTRPCPVCEGKKHGVDSCSKVKSVSYDDDDVGTITAIEFEAKQEPSKA